MKSGKVTMGQKSTLKSLRSGKAKLVCQLPKIERKKNFGPNEHHRSSSLETALLSASLSLSVSHRKKLGLIELITDNL
jgi:hypothetical protein